MRVGSIAQSACHLSQKQELLGPEFDLLESGRLGRNRGVLAAMSIEELEGDQDPETKIEAAVVKALEKLLTELVSKIKEDSDSTKSDSAKGGGK